MKVSTEAVCSSENAAEPKIAIGIEVSAESKNPDEKFKSSGVKTRHLRPCAESHGTSNRQALLGKTAER